MRSTTHSVLVVAAHPDDEVLGCGGTLARLSRAGAAVHVAFLADGVSSRPADDSVQAAALASRRAAARKACDVLGVRSLSFGDFADNQMDTVPLLSIVQAIEALVAEHEPRTIFSHHAGDLNIDHRRTHDAVAAACRPQSGHPVKTILTFEVASSTEWQLRSSAPSFTPNWFVDISDTLEVKLAALDLYAAELRAWPHPRSRQAVEHLARWRGATAGVEAAEAFILGRNIE